jgi:single-strand DNA-binding protein
VATNFVWTDANNQKQEKAEFHNIVAWRKLADVCARYLHKGSKVYIEGRLQTRSWDDQSGNRRYMTEIIAENMIMLDTKGMGAKNTPTAPPTPMEENTPIIDINEPTSNDEIKVEEVPF